jgi:hypothetical protein
MVLNKFFKFKPKKTDKLDIVGRNFAKKAYIWKISRNLTVKKAMNNKYFFSQKKHIRKILYSKF